VVQPYLQKTPLCARCARARLYLDGACARHFYRRLSGIFFFSLNLCPTRRNLCTFFLWLFGCLPSLGLRA
jgi:hypothetical protein